MDVLEKGTQTLLEVTRKCSWKFWKIHKKTSTPQSVLNKLPAEINLDTKLLLLSHQGQTDEAYSYIRKSSNNANIYRVSWKNSLMLNSHYTGIYPQLKRGRGPTQKKGTIYTLQHINYYLYFYKFDILQMLFCLKQQLIFNTTDFWIVNYF